MAKKVKVKGKLRLYFVLLIAFGIILTFINIPIYFLNIFSGLVISLFLIIYFIGLFVMWAYLQRYIVDEMVNFAMGFGQIQKKLLKELDLPYVLIDRKAKILWANDKFISVTGKEGVSGKSISNVFSEITHEILPEEEYEKEVRISFDSREFRAKIRKINIEGLIEDSPLIEDVTDDNYLYGLYLFDETALKIALKEIDDQSVVVGMIYLDNYEEALENVDDVRKSLLLALVDRKITQCISSVDGIVRKTEKDKYLLILRKKALAELKESRFDILEEIKTVSIGNERPITLSIGIGLDGLSYSQNSEFARAAIDLALGRGGDQAVVKSPGNVQYYGGKSQQTEKNTRVKARVKAQALREILINKEQIFIMGHRIGDVDSFGSAIGIYCVAKALEKKAYIVMNDITPSLKPLVDLFTNNKEAYPDLIIKSEAALQMVGNNAALVVVDTNKPSIAECPELLKYCKAIVVLDHHRQGEETIDNATLSYVEPYASSACEMVAEILQYVDDGIKLSGIEADTLYSGIMIDTNNFVTKTGVRTFEAAAFLRRNGADVTRVRKLFREDASEYLAKAKTIKDTTIYRNDYAIAICDASGCQSPTIVAAQAANELLNIKGVKASFVFTEYQSKVFLSARSIDELNVQVVTEKLGGGGHMNIAGAQFENVTAEEAADMLRATIDSMIENEEI
ncbi:MAG: DHH family phosphoesterase [Lachnospiraceae bacterium]|nr:DHH family phosphoesterase [Lachnospiraceae bacterium]